MGDVIRLGAVMSAFDSAEKWKKIADYSGSEGMPVEIVPYTDYLTLVDDLLNGNLDIAWNSSLAWIDAISRSCGQVKTGAMRKTDKGRRSYLIASKDSGIETTEDLKGKTIGFGAADSPEARLIPQYDLHLKGLEAGEDYIEKRFEAGEGPHGELAGGQKSAALAVQAGVIDASYILDSNYDALIGDGTLDENKIMIVSRTPEFDRYVFTGKTDIDQETFDRWNRIICNMDESWTEGRTTEFSQLFSANQYLKFLSQNF